MDLQGYCLVESETSVRETLAHMRGAGGRTALITRDGELIGIFSERDLIHRVDHADPAWQDLPVAEVMTAMPMIIREDDTVAEALRRMNVGKRRHLPIIRDRSTAVGMISIRDILSYLASRFPAHFINLPPDPEHEAHAPWGG